MKLNRIERAVTNNPIRSAHMRHREAAWFHSLSGGLAGQNVLEVGCGRGIGAEILLDRLGAQCVTAFDLDDSMVEHARRFLHARPVLLSVGDVCQIAQPSNTFDAVADFGIIHHVPDWNLALREIARVLRPGGLLLFEEVPRPILDSWPVRTFTEHPRENRFEAAEFVAALSHNGLHGAARFRLGGLVFVGAARKS